jgi:multidrug resistance protein, MATE family
LSAGALRESFRLAWPLVLSNLSVPLLGMVDTAVVGRLPEPYALGGVALGANLTSAVYFAFGFLRMGTTALTAQALGGGDTREIRATAWRAFMLAACIGLLCILAIPMALTAGSAGFAPGPAIDAEFRGYLQIRLLGAPLALANAVTLGWLLGMQDSKGPLVLLIATNLVNAALDVLFVWGLGFTAPGVALATVIAEGFGLCLGLWLLRRHLARTPDDARPSRAQVLALVPFQRLFRLNRDLFLRTIVLQAAFLSFMALASRQGPVVLAANAVLMHFFFLAAHGLDGFAYAAEAMVGRAVGARNAAALRAAARAGFVNAGILSALIGLAFWLTAPWIVGLLTAIEPVRATALDYRLVVAVLPVIAIWAFLFDGIFIGATRTAELRNAMVASIAVYGLAAAVLVPTLGNPGLWAAMLLFLASRGLFLGLLYRRAGFGASFAAPSAPG